MNFLIIQHFFNIWNSSRNYWKMVASYSRQSISNSESVVEVSDLSANLEVDEEDYEKLRCYYNMPSYGQMIFLWP